MDKQIHQAHGDVGLRIRGDEPHVSEHFLYGLVRLGNPIIPTVKHCDVVKEIVVLAGCLEIAFTDG